MDVQSLVPPHSSVVVFDWKTCVLMGFASASTGIMGVLFNFLVPVLLQTKSLIESKAEQNVNSDTGTDANGGLEEKPGLHKFGFTPAIAFAISSLESLLSTVICPFVGNWSDKIWVPRLGGRRKPFVLIGMPLTILAWVATPFATHDGEVIAYIALFSFFIAFPRPTIASYLGDLFPSEVRSKAMGLSALIQALIAGITLVSVGKIVKTSVWAGFLFVGIFSVLLVILSMTFLEERRVPAMEATVQGNPLLDVGKNIKTCWKHSPRCFVLMCAGFFWFCASNMLQATVTSFAVAVLKIPPGDTLTFVTIFALAFLLTAVPAGMFTHSSKARFTSILVAHLLMIPLCVCIYLFVKNKMFFLVILFAAGSLSSLIFTNFLPLIYDAAGHGKGSPPGKLRSLTAYEDANNASVAELRAEALRDLDGRSVAAADQQAAAAAEGTPGEELIAKKASGLEAGLEAVDLNVEAKPQKQDSLAVPGAAVVGAGGQQQQPLPPLGRPSAVLDVKPLDSGSLVGLWYICINLGSVIGPVAAGGLVTGTGDFAAVFLLGAGFISASTILLCVAWWVIKTGPKIRH